jgi:hypothetical protein
MRPPLYIQNEKPTALLTTTPVNYILEVHNTLCSHCFESGSVIVSTEWSLTDYRKKSSPWCPITIPPRLISLALY